MGPAFEPGERLPAVRAVDLYSLMAELMEVPPARTDGSIAPFEPLLASQTPVRVNEARWRCGEEIFTTRSAFGLAAIHHEGRVFALPQVISASGARYADSGIEFWNKGAAARIEIDGRIFADCRIATNHDAG